MLFEDYSLIITNSIHRICTEQGGKILQAAEYVADVIETDGLIYIFGCGHSGMLACEGFYRAGGLVNVSPVFCEPLMLHESAVESSRLEKCSGYAKKLWEIYQFEQRDMVFCFSTSDKNAVPVEFAAHITSQGIPTVGVCSSSYFSQEVNNACKKHLHEVCAMYIDNCVPFGDGCLSIDNSGINMAPLSTITSTFILNSILSEGALMAHKRGIEVPVYLSGNIPGGSEYNRTLIERYSSRIRYL